MKNNDIQSKDNRKSKKRKIITGVILTIIIIVILLLLRCCEKKEGPTDPPVGDFEITDEQKEQDESSDENVIPQITFVGRGEYTVSKVSPSIELRNSEKNKDLGANFVFSLIDAKTNDTIAVTDQVKPGQYVYVNMLDYYKNNGSYDIKININVTDKNGNQMNGMNQDAVLHVTR